MSRRVVVACGLVFLALASTHTFAETHAESWLSQSMQQKTDMLRGFLTGIQGAQEILSIVSFELPGQDEETRQRIDGYFEILMSTISDGDMFEIINGVDEIYSQPGYQDTPIGSVVLMSVMGEAERMYAR